MELAVVLVMVLIGTGAIVYAGMRTEPARNVNRANDSASTAVPPVSNDGSDAGGDGSAT